MAIYNLYIFDRSGTCIYYTEWKRTRESSVNKNEEFKLLYGLLVSLNSFICRLSPVSNKCTFRSFQTTSYKLSYFETATSLKFVLNSDLTVNGIHDLLRQIYAEVTSVVN
ncbi:unnamed protein product [Soboliphyme baturini]|uniref:Trafficking protein particle complex subunit n=1 Tax=Soboliphyme baturini TaxID=241478 RepID=A0A183ICA3_9BILA|nr:unnamed protein product [Soboliphyme baturini]